ncbi:MAG: F0F1 ATP synthase subunit delta [Patescibacteria group bacterium]|nr:F0F1 ATP synthase subunit delta [Patescibacteria group bacterium]
MTNQPRVVITTAHKLTPTQKKAVESEIRRKIGQEFELKEVVNSGVIGGLKITVGLKEFDVTIAGKLAKLQSQLPTATVVTAVKLSDDQRKKIKQAIEKNQGPIDFREVIDPKVVGGLKVRVGSTEYDGTIASKLEKIKKILQQQ